MNPMFVLSAVIAGAAAAPTYNTVAGAPLAAAPLVAAPIGYAQHQVVAPVAYAQHQVVAPAAISVPAPYSTEQIQGPDAVSINAPAPIVTKSLSFGKKQFVSGHVSQILKPAIPDFRIAVPTALKGTISHNAPIVKHVSETHVVNEPFPVERRVEVPYDAPVYKEVIHERPVAVPTFKHVPVKTPVAVRGHDIVQNVQGAPIVQRTHQHVHHSQAVSYAQAAPALGYATAAAPALGYAHTGAHALGYAHGAAPAIATVAGGPAVYSGQYGIAAGQYGLTAGQYGIAPGQYAYEQPAVIAQAE